MKHFITILLCLLVLSAAFSCTSPPASAMGSTVVSEEEELLDCLRLMQYDKAADILMQHLDDIPNNKFYRQFCKTWQVSEYDDALSNAHESAKLDGGVFYEIGDCFYYIPDSVNAKTKYLVYYPGANGGWSLDQNLAADYVNHYQPNAICIFYKTSKLPYRYRAGDRTAEIMRALCFQTGIAPQNVTVLGSSLGGYTALHCAAKLCKNYGIVTERIVSLDMGNNWYEEDFLITEREAKPLVEMQTAIYEFGKPYEVQTLSGAMRVVSYGIPFFEVGCTDWDHDRITRNAFRDGTLSWAVGQRALDSQSYTITEISPPAAQP